MIRYVTIPEPLTLKRAINVQTKEPVKLGFSDFIMDLILMDPLWRNPNDRSWIDAARRIKTKFENAKPSDVIDLDSTLWDKLNQVANRPTKDYPPTLMPDIFDFIYAIAYAADPDPKTQKEKQG